MTPFSILPRNLLFSFDNGISSDENVAISVTRLRLVLHSLWSRFTKFLQISNTCQEASAYNQFQSVSFNEVSTTKWCEAR